MSFPFNGALSVNPSLGCCNNSKREEGRRKAMGKGEREREREREKERERERERERGRIEKASLPPPPFLPPPPPTQCGIFFVERKRVGLIEATAERRRKNFSFSVSKSRRERRETESIFDEFRGRLFVLLHHRRRFRPSATNSRSFVLPRKERQVLMKKSFFFSFPSYELFRLSSPLLSAAPPSLI